MSKFGSPQIDLFASRVNKKCKVFVSWFPDPDAISTDAFTIYWGDFFFYAFPPFSVILRMLHKIKNESAQGIVEVPSWPAQPWYPLYKSLLVCNPIIFRPQKDLLFSFNRDPHPLWKNLSLEAGILSGRPSKN